MDYNQICELELGGLYGAEVVRDISDTIKLYEIYEGNLDWDSDDRLDYEPTKKKSNYVKKLIKEQARFLFGRMPEINVVAQSDSESEKADEIQKYINKVLKDNLFKDKLIKGARDAFIGKRVALKLHAGIEGMKIMFIPSTEFIFETKQDDTSEIEKIIFFYMVEDAQEKSAQRIWRQKYELIDGKCLLTEGFYDGTGTLIDDLLFDEYDTGLTFIPAYVIFNDGLSGDLNGESDVAELIDNQLVYNMLASNDIDSLKKGMNEITYGTDVDEDSMDSFKLAPGAFWDVQTSALAGDKQASLGTVSHSFSYDARLENSLKRIKSEMHELLNIPMVDSESLKGTFTSGKAMKALYWQLISRCEEKWNAWNPALVWMVYAIIEISKVYALSDLEAGELIVEVCNAYPLLEDDDLEMQADLKKVVAQTMSRKSFYKKWERNSDVLADEELKQIALERQMLEDSYTNME